MARRGDGVPAPVAAVRGGAALGPTVLAAARGGRAGAGRTEHLPILNIMTFCALLSFSNIYKLSTLWSPRARDFPNPHDGEMKSDPAEKLYETPTKKTMILMKWVDWDFSETQSITLSDNKNK